MYDGLVNMKKVFQPEIVVIGGANIDIQGQSFSGFIPGDSNPGAISRTAGGVGRNIAENCARLGLSVALVSAFGDDEGARWLEDSCNEFGVSTSESLHVPGPSATYLCLLDGDGSLAGAVADMGIMEALSPEFLSGKAGLFDGARAIVADANLPAASLRWLALKYGRIAQRRADEASPLLFLDPVSSAKAVKAQGLSAAFDCIKPNLAEARVLSGSSSERLEEIVKKMEMEGNMPGELFISLGAEGLFFAGQGKRGQVGLPPAEKLPKVTSRSGAGDAAMAAIVWASLAGKGMAAKARLALAAAVLASASKATVSNDMTVAGLQTIAELFSDGSGQFGRV